MKLFIKKRYPELGLIILTILLSSLLRIPPSSASIETFTTELQPKFISNFIQQLYIKMDETSPVGAAVVIVTDSTVLYKETFGVRKYGTNDSINDSTLFRLASVSKGFTGVLGLKLMQEGLINDSDRIASFIPDFTLKDSINTANLSIWDILNHTTGLVPHAFDNLAEAGIPMREIIPRLVEVDISGKPGDYYGYQNITFSLIDTVAKLRTNLSFDSLLQRYLFTPLHMKDAFAGVPNDARKANFAFPHVGTSTYSHKLRFNNRLYNVAPAAGINASINDLSKWVQALVSDNGQVLDTNLLNKLCTPQVITPLRYGYIRYWPGLKDKYYSYGWRIYQWHNTPILYHGGYVKGYRAEIAFSPEYNIGIAYVQNCNGFRVSDITPMFFTQFFKSLSDTTMLE